MKTETFHLVYTRDTTIIIQELWGRACGKVLLDRLGWNNPHKPAVIHYLHNGVIEIWENIAAMDWLMAQILSCNNKDSEFYEKSAKQFEDELTALTALYFGLPYLESAGDLSMLARRIGAVMLDFLVYYYSAIDDRTPEPIKSQARNLRERESFFASSNRLIRDSLVHLYPHLEGYENAILQSEIINPPSVGGLKKRRQHFLVVDGEANGVMTLDSFSKETGIIMLRRATTQNIAEVKGSVAYPGHIFGKVFLLFRREQIQNVRDGAVIVSPMTTPDFMSAMKKAVAFVTDEGGLTCHAAIVAREMKKPCIIGTKIATKVFKDGDLVEVDAEKGIVRKLDKQ